MDIDRNKIIEALKKQTNRFVEVQVYNEVASTMDIAFKQGEIIESGKLLSVIADSQTDGRGRHGRSWFSLTGRGVYLSVAIKVNMNPSEFPMLSPAAGLAVARVVEKISGLKPKIKWPNDVLLNNRKVGGIILESNTQANLVVAGVGLNVGHKKEDFPREIKDIASSVFIESGRLKPRSEIIALLIVELDRAFNYVEKNKKIEREQFFSYMEINKKVTIGEITGKIKDVLDDGSLLIDQEDGSAPVRVFSGEIKYR